MTSIGQAQGHRVQSMVNHGGKQIKRRMDNLSEPSAHVGGPAHVTQCVSSFLLSVCLLLRQLHTGFFSAPVTSPLFSHIVVTEITLDVTTRVRSCCIQMLVIIHIYVFCIQSLFRSSARRCLDTDFGSSIMFVELRYIFISIFFTSTMHYHQYEYYN